MMRVAAGLIVAAMLWCLTGCTHVIRYDTPYYEGGPSQLAPPQGELSRGTHVFALGSEGSYRHVIAGNGVNAYVLESSLMSLGEWLSQPKAPKESDQQSMVEWGSGTTGEAPQ